MPQIPRDDALDGTLALVREGYDFIRTRCDRLGSDLFETRLMGETTICMRGEEAARLLYDESRFRRQDAAPKIAKMTLLGEGGVQGLDDEAHRHRKAMFMSLMTPDSTDRLAVIASDLWDAYIDRWVGSDDDVELFHQSSELLCRAICRWADVPLANDEVEKRTDQMLAMIDGPATIGPRYWRGRRARRGAERWAKHLIGQVRDGELQPTEGSALRVVAEHRDLDGQPLEPKIAAVELVGEENTCSLSARSGRTSHRSGSEKDGATPVSVSSGLARSAVL